MFCGKCGKQFDGPGYVCPECLQAKESQAPTVEELAAPQVSESFQAPEPPKAPQPAYTGPETTPGFTLGGEGGGKKKKTGLIAGVLVLVVALVAGAVALVLNWDKLFSRGDKIPEDPDDYVAFLEEPNMRALCDDISQAYGLVMGQPSDGDVAVSGQVTLELGEQMLSMLSQAVAAQGMEMDVDWLRAIALDYTVISDSDSGLAQMDLGLLIGSEKILSLLTTTDAENMVVYMALPELNEQFVKMDMGMDEDLLEFYAQSATIGQKFLEDMPSQEQVRELAERCADVILSYMKDAEKETGTLTIGDGEKEVTVLTVKLSQEDVCDLALEMLELLQKDKTLKKAVDAFVAYINEVYSLQGYADPVSADEFYDALDEAIDEIQAVKETAEDGNYLHYTIYADGADALARGVDVYSDGEKVAEIFLGTLVDGEDYYSQVSVTSGGEDMLMCQGEGKLEDNLLSCEYTLEVEGVSLLTVVLEDVDTATWYGTYTLIPEAALLEQLDMDSTVAAMASSAELEAKVEEGSLRLAVRMGNSELLAVELTVDEASEALRNIPKDAVDIMDESALTQWMEGMKLDKVLDALEDAGMPGELVDELRSMIG